MCNDVNTNSFVSRVFISIEYPYPCIILFETIINTNEHLNICNGTMLSMRNATINVPDKHSHLCFLKCADQVTLLKSANRSIRLFYISTSRRKRKVISLQVVLDK